MIWSLSNREKEAANHNTDKFPEILRRERKRGAEWGGVWPLKKSVKIHLMAGGIALTEFKMQKRYLSNIVSFHVLSSVTPFGQLGQTVRGHLLYFEINSQLWFNLQLGGGCNKGTTCATTASTQSRMPCYAFCILYLSFSQTEIQIVDQLSWEQSAIICPKSYSLILAYLSSDQTFKLRGFGQ